MQYAQQKATAFLQISPLVTVSGMSTTTHNTDLIVWVPKKTLIQDSRSLSFLNIDFTRGLSFLHFVLLSGDSQHYVTIALYACSSRLS